MPDLSYEPTSITVSRIYCSDRINYSCYVCVCVFVSRSVDPAVAGKAFKKLRYVLADAAAVAPDRLANELYSDSIISRATLRLVLENSPASIVKMLDDVEGWLERDGRHFSRLLTVFKNSSALTIDFAARLVNNYRECEFECVHSISLLTCIFNVLVDCVYKGSCIN